MSTTTTADTLKELLSLNEIKRLVEGAIGDLKLELDDPQAWQRPPNPAKRDEYMASRRRIFDRKVQRLTDLLHAWQEIRMEVISG